MIVCIKTILLTLMLFLLSYSQQGGIGDMQIRLMGSSHGSGIVMPRIYGDTIELGHDKSYAIFSGSFQKIKSESYAYRELKVKSVIRGDIDTTANNKSIVRIYNLKCSDIEFEVNKDYLVLDIIRYNKPSISPYVSQLRNCENVFPDTPANREVLINKFENKVIINEP